MPLVLEDFEQVVDSTIQYSMDYEVEDTPQMLEGNCIIKGKTKLGLTVPSKTSIIQTKMFNEVLETTMAPAIINYSEKEDGILCKALKKQFNEQPVLNEDTLDQAVYSYKRMLGKLPSKRSMRKLNYREAVEGIPFDDYIKGIERSTSAGWPFCTTSKHGKKEWFGNDNGTCYN